MSTERIAPNLQYAMDNCGRQNFPSLSELIVRSNECEPTVVLPRGYDYGRAAELSVATVVVPQTSKVETADPPSFRPQTRLSDSRSNMRVQTTDIDRRIPSPRSPPATEASTDSIASTLTAPGATRAKQIELEVIPPTEVQRFSPIARTQVKSPTADTSTTAAAQAVSTNPASTDKASNLPPSPNQRPTTLPPLGPLGSLQQMVHSTTAQSGGISSARSATTNTSSASEDTIVSLTSNSNSSSSSSGSSTSRSADSMTSPTTTESARDMRSTTTPSMMQTRTKHSTGYDSRGIPVPASVTPSTIPQRAQRPQPTAENANSSYQTGPAGREGSLVHEVITPSGAVIQEVVQASSEGNTRVIYNIMDQHPQQPQGVVVHEEITDIQVNETEDDEEGNIINETIDLSPGRKHIIHEIVTKEPGVQGKLVSREVKITTLERETESKQETTGQVTTTTTQSTTGSSLQQSRTTGSSPGIPVTGFTTLPAPPPATSTTSVPAGRTWMDDYAATARAAPPQRPTTNSAPTSSGFPQLRPNADSALPLTPLITPSYQDSCCTSAELYKNSNLPNMVRSVSNVDQTRTDSAAEGQPVHAEPLPSRPKPTQLTTSSPQVTSQTIISDTTTTHTTTIKRQRVGGPSQPPGKVQHSSPPRPPLSSPPAKTPVSNKSTSGAASTPQQNVANVRVATPPPPAPPPSFSNPNIPTLQLQHLKQQTAPPARPSPARTRPEAAAPSPSKKPANISPTLNLPPSPSVSAAERERMATTATAPPPRGGGPQSDTSIPITTQQTVAASSDNVTQLHTAASRTEVAVMQNASPERVPMNGTSPTSQSSLMTGTSPTTASTVSPCAPLKYDSSPDASPALQLLSPQALEDRYSSFVPPPPTRAPGTTPSITSNRNVNPSPHTAPPHTTPATTGHQTTTQNPNTVSGGSQPAPMYSTGTGSNIESAKYYKHSSPIASPLYPPMFTHPSQAVSNQHLGPSPLRHHPHQADPLPQVPRPHLRPTTPPSLSALLGQPPLQHNSYQHVSQAQAQATLPTRGGSPVNVNVNVNIRRSPVRTGSPLSPTAVYIRPASVTIHSPVSGDSSPIKATSPSSTPPPVQGAMSPLPTPHREEQQAIEQQIRQEIQQQVEHNKRNEQQHTSPSHPSNLPPSPAHAAAAAQAAAKALAAQDSLAAQNAVTHNVNMEQASPQQRPPALMAEGYRPEFPNSPRPAPSQPPIPPSPSSEGLHTRKQLQQNMVSTTNRPPDYSRFESPQPQSRRATPPREHPSATPPKPFTVVSHLPNSPVGSTAGRDVSPSVTTPVGATTPTGGIRYASPMVLPSSHMKTISPMDVQSRFREETMKWQQLEERKRNLGNRYMAAVEIEARDWRSTKHSNPPSTASTRGNTPTGATPTIPTALPAVAYDYYHHTPQMTESVGALRRSTGATVVIQQSLPPRPKNVSPYRSCTPTGGPVLIRANRGTSELVKYDVAMSREREFMSGYMMEENTHHNIPSMSSVFSHHALHTPTAATLNDIDPTGAAAFVTSSTAEYTTRDMAFGVSGWQNVNSGPLLVSNGEFVGLSGSEAHNHLNRSTPTFRSHTPTLEIFDQLSSELPRRRGRRASTGAPFPVGYHNVAHRSSSLTAFGRAPSPCVPSGIGSVGPPGYGGGGGGGGYRTPSPSTRRYSLSNSSTSLTHSNEAISSALVTAGSYFNSIGAGNKGFGPSSPNSAAFLSLSTNNSRQPSPTPTTRRDSTGPPLHVDRLINHSSSSNATSKYLTAHYKSPSAEYLNITSAATSSTTGTSLAEIPVSATPYLSAGTMGLLSSLSHNPSLSPYNPHNDRH